MFYHLKISPAHLLESVRNLIRLIDIIIHTLQMRKKKQISEVNNLSNTAARLKSAYSKCNILFTTAHSQDSLLPRKNQISGFSHFFNVASFNLYFVICKQSYMICRNVSLPNVLLCKHFE